MRDPRDKVVLSTLEEDFKNIGIIEESKESDEVVENDEVEVDDTDSDLEEGRRRAAGGRKSVKTKRMSAGAKSKARSSYRKRKSKIKKARKKRGRTSRGKKLAKLAKAMAKKESVELASSDRINSILEDVRDIVASVNEDDNSTQDLDNAIKSLANVAIISEMLANYFAESVELLEDEGELSTELSEAAAYFQEQAEQAAFLATALDEGTELDEDFDVDEIFEEFMSALVEGLDLYADLTEDEDEEDLDEDEDEDELEEDEEDLEEMEDDCDKCKGKCKCDMKESTAVERMRALMAGND
jgi:type IV secretory pathway VirJ component